MRFFVKIVRKVEEKENESLQIVKLNIINLLRIIYFEHQRIVAKETSQTVPLSFIERTLVKFNPAITYSVALNSPILKICLSYLQIIQRKESVSLTKTGALPTKIVNELHTKKYIAVLILSKLANVRTEKDSISIQLVKIVSTIARLAKIRQRKLSFTAKGISILKSSAKLLVLNY